MKYFLADSYAGFDTVGEPFENEKGKKVIKVKRPCPRCGGLGLIISRVENGVPIPIPVDSGVCYKCGGSGIEEKVVRVYDDKEYQRMQKSKERAKERKRAEAAAREKDLIENMMVYKHEAAIKHGFDEDEKIYIVYGGNTYNIKDQLKAMGAHFDPIFKWYFSKVVDNLPEGYAICSFSFDEVCEYCIQTKGVSIRKDADQVIKRRLDEFKEPSASIHHPSPIGSRLRNLQAKVVDIRGFDGYYGHTYIYKFADRDYIFVWMTTKELDIEVGDMVELTGTIKKLLADRKSVV